jgi:UDPglucose 6-dehydrogenase
MRSAQIVFPDITFANSTYEAMNNAHALLILTEWDEFKELDLRLVKNWTLLLTHRQRQKRL